MGAALSFRLLGLNSYHCISLPVGGSPDVSRFFYEGTRETLGSVMVVEHDAVTLAGRIIADLDARRVALGWASAGTPNPRRLSALTDTPHPHLHSHGHPHAHDHGHHHHSEHHHHEAT